jgi:hypothetical protein
MKVDVFCLAWWLLITLVNTLLRRKCLVDFIIRILDLMVAGDAYRVSLMTAPCSWSLGELLATSKMYQGAIDTQIETCLGVLIS